MSTPAFLVRGTIVSDSGAALEDALVAVVDDDLVKTLDGVELRIVDRFRADAGSFWERAVDEELGELKDAGLLDRALLQFLKAPPSWAWSPFATFDHWDRVIRVHRANVESQGIDALEVILAHEIVHAGQYRRYPELKAEREASYRAFLRAVRHEIENETSPFGTFVTRAKEEHFGLHANIEGYAWYIQTDFVQREVGTLLWLPARGLAERIWHVVRAWGRAKPRRKTEARRAEPARRRDRYLSMGREHPEFDVGRAAYRQRQVGDRPARFRPKLRPARS